MALSTLKVSRRGSGSPQYPLPRMSAVVIYCYSQGVMSSRKNVHYDRAGNLEQQLRADIEELLQQGEKIDREETEREEEPGKMPKKRPPSSTAAGRLVDIGSTRGAKWGTFEDS